MINEQFKKEQDRYTTVYNSETLGKSPNEVSFEKSNEIYAILATPLKNMRYKAMKDAAKGCFKDKWMDEAVPNPHQVEMCRERMQNKHMGIFYRNLVSLRESNQFKYQDCVVAAGNNVEQAVMCIRGYIAGLDNDN